jgi:iron(III) transport system substrate-binding protein
MKMVSKHRWATIALVGLIAAVACSPAAVPSSGTSRAVTANKPEGWDDLVAAAKKEGVVTVYNANAVNRPALVDAFQEAYPDIKVELTVARQDEQINRIDAERRAGRYLSDVFVGGTGPGLVTLKQAGFSAPLQPMLVLPEVLDTSAWLGNKLWWADASEPYTALMFQGSLQIPVAYNTRSVDPTQFKTYWDLLDPKWKGKIASTDIRRVGPGLVAARFIYLHPQLGPEYMRRLFSEMDLTLSSDQRQLIDWVAQDRFPLGIFLFDTEVSMAAEQGLPVQLAVGQFKEGEPLGPSGGTLYLIDRAPHPNAAKVYINWLLSREGQMAWQRLTREPSRRVDIPKDGLRSGSVPKPGVEYMDGGSEEVARVTNEMVELVTQALQQTGR